MDGASGSIGRHATVADEIARDLAGSVGLAGAQMAEAG
jgi:hypothetical protein